MRLFWKRRGPEEYDVRGFRTLVENTRSDISTADVVERLEQALALIERADLRRFRHLRRDVRHIHVARYPCRGAYFPQEQSCLTELTFLARRDITEATVAASIVHEGMHARIHRMARDPDSWDRAKEERMCRRAELEFGRMLPPELGAPVIERAIAALQSADEEVAPAIDWNEAIARQNAIDRGAGQW